MNKKAMLAAFEKAADKNFFKGNALEETQRISIAALEDAEIAFEQKLAEAKAKIVELTSKLDVEQFDRKEADEQIDFLKEKMARVIERNNAERKNATARANRYKAKYERLLSDIDLAIPGSKGLLETKAIAKHDQRKKIERLTAKIELQKQKINEKKRYDPDSQRDIFMPGYGKQWRILNSLVERKESLEAQKSY